MYDYVFPDFIQALNFAQAISQIAEKKIIILIYVWDGGIVVSPSGLTKSPD
ncbi:hypothetical protein [Rickettsiella massiliensis]|uniref:hypothetical protein n=1 Tax=Rickettsiella massiliensis TaxID=676517 RepID=UPI0002E967A5|nr:hypothetical protein [Rickettsiella massiliensis]